MKSKYLLSILVIFYATTYTIAEESQEVQNQAVQNQEDSSTAVSPQSEEDSSVTFDRNVHYNINDISLYKNAFSGQRHRYPPSRPPILRTRTMPTYTPPSTQSWTRPTRRRTRNRVRRTRSTAPVTAESTTPVTVETQTPQREGYQKAYNEEPITPYSPPYQYSPPINLGLPQQSNGNNAGPINVDTANVLDVLLKPRGGGPYGNYGGGYGQGGYGQGGYGQGGYGDGMGGGGMGGGGMGGGGMGGGGMGGGGMGGGGLGGYGQSGYGNDYGPVGNGGGTTPSNYDDLGGYDDQGYDDEGYEDLTASTKNVETPNNKKQPMSNKNSNYDEDEYGTGLYSDTDN